MNNFGLIIQYLRAWWWDFYYQRKARNQFRADCRRYLAREEDFLEYIGDNHIKKKTIE